MPARDRRSDGRTCPANVPHPCPAVRHGWGTLAGQPRANALHERFLDSAPRECLGHVPAHPARAAPEAGPPPVRRLRRNGPAAPRDWAGDTEAGRAGSGGILESWQRDDRYSGVVHVARTDTRLHPHRVFRLERMYEIARARPPRGPAVVLPASPGRGARVATGRVTEGQAHAPAGWGTTICLHSDT